MAAFNSGFFSTATVIFSDAFSYPDGPLVLVSVGRWKTHSGTTEQVDVSAGRLRLSQRNTEDVNIALVDTGVISATNCPALYAAFSVVFSQLPAGANGAYFAHFKDSSPTSGFRCRIFATTNSAAPGCFRMGIAAAGSTASGLLPDDLNLGTVYRLVCRLSLSDNTSTLWVNPSLESDPSAVSTDTVSAVKPVVGFAFRESLAGSNGMGNLEIDDFVVATSFKEALGSAVVPELTLHVRRALADQVQLTWIADPSLTYSVWASANVSEPFYLIATALGFVDQTGFFNDEVQEGAVRLYRVSSP